MAKKAPSDDQMKQMTAHGLASLPKDQLVNTYERLFKTKAPKKMIKKELAEALLVFWGTLVLLHFLIFVFCFSSSLCDKSDTKKIEEKLEVCVKWLSK
jgi:hypothetical protein